MDRKPAASDLLAKRVLYSLPDMDAVSVRRDIAYTMPADAGLTMDVYSPPGRNASHGTPAVVLVPGFPGAVKRIGAFVSWAELMAASGLVAITCATKEPAADTEAVLGYVREHAASLGIDGDRMGALGVFRTRSQRAVAAGTFGTGLSEVRCILLRLPARPRRFHRGRGCRETVWLLESLLEPHVRGSSERHTSIRGSCGSGRISGAERRARLVPGGVRARQSARDLRQSRRGAACLRHRG